MIKSLTLVAILGFGRTQAVEWKRYKTSQCHVNSYSRVHGSDTATNPIWNIGTMTRTQCQEECLKRKDSRGRSCIAIEMGTRSNDPNTRASCALAWGCDYTARSSGGDVFVDAARDPSNEDVPTFALGRPGCHNLRVTDGGNCVETFVYRNNEECEIHVNRALPIRADFFDVEYHHRCGYDWVEFPSGDIYCGGSFNGPIIMTPDLTDMWNGSPYITQGTMIWKTDRSVLAGGFKFCAEADAPCQIPSRMKSGGYDCNWRKGCINNNQAIGSLPEAWKKCAEHYRCTRVMRYNNGYYYLRTADDIYSADARFDYVDFPRSCAGSVGRRMESETPTLARLQEAEVAENVRKTPRLHAIGTQFIHAENTNESAEQFDASAEQFDDATAEQLEA